MIEESKEAALTSAVEAAQLAADLAKLDLIQAQGRQEFGDEKLDLLDIAAIGRSATEFRVPRRAAYLRARSLGLLSYQRPPSPTDQARQTEDA